MSHEAKKVQRAFETALLMAGIQGSIDRIGGGKAAKPRKIVSVIYDHERKLFKAPLEPRGAKGDRLSLSDGRAFQVAAARVFTVDGVECYQELEVEAS